MTEPPTQASPANPNTLGEALRTAREAKGLSLQTVADRTRIRQAYLEAFENNAVDEFPSTVYARNFVRLFAHEVGLPEARATELFEALTGTVATPNPAAASQSEAQDIPTVQRTPRRPTPTPVTRKTVRLPSGLLLTAALLIAVIAGGMWGVNTLFSNAATQPAPDPAAATPDIVSDAPAETLEDAAPAANGTEDAAVTEDADASQTGTEGDLLAAPSPAGPNGLPAEVQISVQTNPPGASVSVDAFPLPGATPIENVPVTARPQRTLTITLDGYEPLRTEETFTEDRTFSFDLTPVTESGSAPAANQTADGASGLRLVVRERSWLEAYQGLERGEGERLAYTTAQPGSEYEFDLPVYIRLGNAGGVDVFLNGEQVEPIGPDGGVAGAAFASD